MAKTLKVSPLRAKPGRPPKKGTKKMSKKGC